MKKGFLFFFVLIIISWSCESEKPTGSSRVVIGINSDVENLNPLYAFGLLEGNIREILFASLVKHNWNEEIGDLETTAFLADRWEWNQDSTSIIFHLREHLFWSDGVKITTEDVFYSFDLYSDANVSSTFYGSFENFYLGESQQIDLKRTFEILSPSKIKINFRPGSKPNLFDVDMPILPKHVFSKISRLELNKTNIEKDLVFSGPYFLSSWKKNEVIVLKSSESSFLYNEDMVKEIIFKVVPDENSKITQLKKGEIDLIEDINVESISDLKKFDHIKIVTRAGRDYDYIGWNHLDPQLYANSKALNPNIFFGSSKVRIALSHAINREEILTEYLQGFGQLSFGPISPIFKTYYNKNLQPHEYNPSKAKELLTSEGWNDRDKNGILEKNNKEFSFKLHIGGGNPRRAFAATVVKNNLKAIGIDVTIEIMEMGTFINKLFGYELDAWMAGWTIPIPLDIQPYWHSNFEKSPFNISGLNNREVDDILEAIEKEKNIERKTALIKNFQEIIHEIEPVTFLYWIDVKTAYNSRIDNIKINPLGAIQHCWEWRLKNYKQ